MATVAELTERYGVKATVTPTGYAVRDEDGWEHNAYRVTLRMDGRRIQTPFRCGLGIRETPDAATVLSGLLMDASCADEGDFAEFCAALGYDTDSRKAYRLYQACVRTERKLQAFLGEHAAEFMDADRD